MSFDILREFDTLYAHKPTQTSTTQSPSGFSFFDSLASTHANPQKPAASVFSDAFIPPQRPSSVQLPMQSAYRGVPQPMTRNKSNPLSDNAGSSFNDLVSLLEAPGYAPSPMNNPKQTSRSRSPTFNGMNTSSLGGKDPFAALAGSSGLKGIKSSYTPSPPKSNSTFSWGRKSPVILQQEEGEDFGDFAEASSTPMKTPALPSRALQNSGNGFRRSLSISTHIPTTPNYSAFYQAKTPSKVNLGLNSSNPSLSLFGNNGFTSSNTTTIQQANAPAVDDDFGDFIASPTKSEFPTQFPKSNLPLIANPVPPTPTSIPLGIIPLPTPVTTPVTTTIKKSTPIPALPPLSIILTAFPTIFTQPATFLFSKLTQHPYPLRQRIFSHPKTKDFLLGTCEAARVAGRIIAGRKSRAKRTKIGSNSGSDLETQKEDREIAELVRIWKDECAGRLKAAMVTPHATPSHNYSSSDPTAASSNPNASRVPELEVNLRVEKVMGKGGSILDEEDRGCVLCGLHQNELISKLYEHEFDMEGRWWVRGWGHRGCLRWWEEWEGGLQSKNKTGR